MERSTPCQCPMTAADGAGWTCCCGQQGLRVQLQRRNRRARWQVSELHAERVAPRRSGPGGPLDTTKGRDSTVLSTRNECGGVWMVWWIGRESGQDREEIRRGEISLESGTNFGLGSQTGKLDRVPTYGRRVGCFNGRDLVPVPGSQRLCAGGECGGRGLPCGDCISKSPSNQSVNQSINQPHKARLPCRPQLRFGHNGSEFALHVSFIANDCHNDQLPQWRK
ncbi:hypothetical protein IWX47DRAFT_491764 [Phyllosticta citricarpa]